MVLGTAFVDVGDVGGVGFDMNVNVGVVLLLAWILVFVAVGFQRST